MPYVGLGNYSTSWINEIWYFNEYRVKDYGEKVNQNQMPIQDYYKLPLEEMYTKYILYSLNFGIIDPQRFKNRFNADFEDIFRNELEYLTQEELLIKHNGVWCINQGSFSNMHIIRGIFYPQDAQKWVIKTLI